ncbi:MAG: hypothetical protein B2I17_07485 [Thermoplasmatales archaeon B_DKE]|nr:MAG: hypothetical protein B2I17_07485 [Thermoplasmatales archaeon B_DKE]QRF74938.1 hypothetical protein Thermo_00431 [Thermoplasmatales archaeon]
MGRIGIFTQDFKFYHDVIYQLREWELPFVSIEDPGQIPEDVPVVLSADGDDQLPRQIKSSNPVQAIRMALPRLLNRYDFNSIIIGIDPGPRPGIAVTADMILTEAYECPDTASVGKEVQEIADFYSYKNISIKIGNGDKPNRMAIMDALEKTNIGITIVDETNTSMPHKIHDNALSAARIAFIEGNYYPLAVPRKFNRKDVYDKEFVTIRKLVLSGQGNS